MKHTSCATKGCTGVPSTPHGQLCKACRRLSDIRRKNPPSNPSLNPPLPPREQRPAFTGIVIGPEAFPRVAPAPATVPIQRIPSVFAAEQQAHDKEWDDWLKRRGL